MSELHVAPSAPQSRDRDRDVQSGPLSFGRIRSVRNWKLQLTWMLIDHGSSDDAANEAEASVRQAPCRGSIINAGSPSPRRAP
jgi:hypothetical protein